MPSGGGRLLISSCILGRDPRKLPLTWVLLGLPTPGQDKEKPRESCDLSGVLVGGSIWENALNADSDIIPPWDDHGGGGERERYSTAKG